MQKGFRRMSGMTMTSFLAVLVGVVFIASIGIRLIPVYVEYFSVVSSLKNVAAEEGLRKASSKTIRDRLVRQFDVNDIESVHRDDIHIEKKGKQKTIILKYEVRKPLLGNIDLIVHFNERAELL